MIIQSKFFDQIEIKDEDIINFDEGILGFEDDRRFILIDMDESSSLKCLQSVDRREVAFIVINPWDFFEDYQIDIDDNALSYFKDSEIENFFIYSILTITESRMTANLIGPVLINAKTKQGKQIVLHKSNYTTRHNISNPLKRV